MKKYWSLFLFISLVVKKIHRLINSSASSFPEDSVYTVSVGNRSQFRTCILYLCQTYTFMIYLQVFCSDYIFLI